MLKHATYVGPRCGMNIEPGMTAMIQTDSGKPGIVLAQFDDFWAYKDGKHLAFNWHEFPAEHFKED